MREQLPHAAAGRRKAAPEIYWHVRKVPRAPAISMLFTSRCFIAFKHFHLRRGQVFDNRQMGNSSKCWNTIPTRERSFARSVFLSLTTIPSTVISPCCTGSRPLTVLISVDLPEPDGPQTTTTSPFSLRLSSRSAPESDHTILKHFSG